MVTDSEVHDVSEETVDMALNSELVFFLDAGTGVEDSGCTRPVMGDKTWEEWIKILSVKGLSSKIIFGKCHRAFKFGNGSTLHSVKTVTFPVRFEGTDRVLEVCLV